MAIVLAFDLETVPDTMVGRLYWGLVGDDAAVAAAMSAKRNEETDGRSDFLKAGFHRVVAVGLAGLSLETGKPPKVKLTSKCEADERGLLEFFLAALTKRSQMDQGAQLVSWNGGSFDLPVIRYRSLLHGVNAGTLYGRPDDRQYDRYDYRYGDRHVDLMDVLSGYGASTAHKLDEAAQLVGLPAKGETTGADVLNLWLAGGYEAIGRYCGHDAIKTLLLFLRFQWTRAWISTSVYHQALEGVCGQLSDREDNLELRKAIGTWQLAVAPELQAAG